MEDVSGGPRHARGARWTSSAAVDEEVDPREALEPIIQEAAALHGVDPDLVQAVIQTESRFDPRAVSAWARRA